MELISSRLGEVWDRRKLGVVDDTVTPGLESGGTIFTGETHNGFPFRLV